jgi:ferredoxin
VALADKTFKFNDKNTVDVLENPGDDEATIKTAAEACPVMAIKLEM